jgi:hypothetical protein
VGRCARTAASFCGFLTLGTTLFLATATAALRAAGWRVAAFLSGFAALVTFFFAGVVGFFVESFFAAALGAAFCALRTGGLDAALLFGRAGLAFNVRPLTDDFVDARRAGVRDVERLSAFVMGLLMCGEAFSLNGRCMSNQVPERTCGV